jgi:hypothetical protein
MRIENLMVCGYSHSLGAVESMKIDWVPIALSAN